MSPGSADKARKMGYTNLKVFKDGMPGWSVRNYGVLSAQSLKEAWIDKDIPHVLLDVRAVKVSGQGFIKGAVAFPAHHNAVPLINKLDLKKNAPIIVYGGKDEVQAVAVAKELLKAGYGNVKLLSGGFEAWTVAGFPVASGKLAVKAAYVPKPRPGEINLDEFKKYAAELPSNVMIIDARSISEGKAGMLKTAKLIPAEEIKDRLAEIPRDKLIVFYCNTGVIAEIAYHTLREMGYTNVKFVNATMVFEKNGSYKISTD
jgi:rhodanese-related sulfurtransferase